MRILATGMLCLAVAACDTPNFRTSQFQFGEAKTLAATGNLRLITERTRKLPENETKVVCTEPSPDYAVGSGTIADASVKAAGTSPISELAGGLTTSETVIKLDGREKGVLALRDGLYAACQAYANGLIGKDAYSIILSQYGMLLVGIMQGAPVISVSGEAAKKPPQINVAGPATGSSFAVMLVACINQYDPTRRDYSEREAPYLYNKMLSREVCRDVVTRAGSGSLH